MKAIILAGGEGRRLRPLTDKLPKPMLPIMNEPLMAHILQLLKKHNITEIGVTLHYKSEQIIEHFKDGEDYGVRLTYFHDTEPRGTAGCLKQAKSFIDDDFLVISGDIVTDSDLTEAIAFHKEKNAVTTLLLKETDNPTDFGVVVTNDDGKIEHFYEQPDWNEVRSDTINTGIYVMKPEILSLIPDGYCDLAHNLFPLLLHKNIPIFGYTMQGYWRDISHVESYQACHRDIFSGTVTLSVPQSELSSGVFIGKDCKIDPGANIEKYTVIGDRVTIDAGAHIKNCILWSGTTVPENAELYRTIVCSGEAIYTSPQFNERSPERTEHRFTGVLNEDITPEWMIRLATAYVQTVKPKSKILLSISDDSRYMMPKFAFLSGLMAAGAEVYNLVGAGDRCVARFALRKLALDGGIHVQFYRDSVSIELFDSMGVPVNNGIIKNVESILALGDYHRADFKEIHQPINVNDIPMYYFKDLIATTPCKRLNFSIAVCARESEIKNRMTKICAAFGISVLYTNDPEYVPHLISQNKLDFGVLIGENGKCAFYDEYGKVLSGDDFYGLITLIVLSGVSGATVYLPMHVSDTTSEIATQLGGTITRMEDYNVESKLLDANTPASRLQHDLCFDPIRSTIRVCEFLYLNHTTLSHCSSVLPKMYKISKHVDCPDRKKGYVMRKIYSIKRNGKNIDFKEGIKLTDDRGWILIMPDYQKNQMHILSESHDEEYANELSGDMSRLVEKIIKE